MGRGITPDPGDPYPWPEAAPVAAASTFAADDAPTAPTRPALPVLDDPNRSPNPSVCPFLRRTEKGALVVPVAFAVEGQTCVAIGAPRGQSIKQQEHVCLRSTHKDCPRYQRGALVAAPAASGSRSGPALPRATLAALLILVLSAGISFGFVVQRGGIAMPVVGGSPSPSQVAAVVTPSPAATDAPVPTEAPLVTDAPVEPSGTSTPTLEPAPAPTPTPTPTPTLEPTPTLAPTAKPTPKPTATPTSSRYKLLKACPDKPDCYIYTVRSGDNLYSIGRYFGHSLQTLYAWNPKYPAARLRVGDAIRMPPPTR
jgi:LysM repeat protein